MSDNCEVPGDVLSQIQSNFEDSSGHGTVDYEAKWNGLNKQRKENQFCDALVQCAGEEVVSSHKCVLALESPYFKTLFTSLRTNTTFNETKEIDLKEYSKHTVEILLDLVYTRKADLSQVNLLELLCLAEFLQCDWLVQHLVKSIRSTMSAKTWVLWFSVGLESGVDDLSTLAISYMESHLGGLAATEGLPPELTEKIVRHRNQVTFKKINLYYNLGHVYLVDTSLKTVERRDTGLFSLKDCLPAQCEEFKIHSFFSSKGKLYRASRYITEEDSPFSNNENYVQISHYDHCLEVFKTENPPIKICEVLETMVEDVCPGVHWSDERGKVETELWVRQLAFDMRDHLYILLTSDVWIIVFKYSLLDGSMLPNFTFMERPDFSLRNFPKFCFLESKRRGTLLLHAGGEHVYDMENFNFLLDRHAHHLPGTHEAVMQPTKVQLCPKCSQTRATNSTDVGNLHRNSGEFRIFHACEVLSLNGEIYAYAVLEKERNKLVVLHLDDEPSAGVLTWVELCHFSIDGYQLSNCFTCSGRSFGVFSLDKFQQREDKRKDVSSGADGEGDANADVKVVEYYSVDEMYEVLYEFVVDKKTLTSVPDMYMPPFGERFMCSEVPEYFQV